MLIEPKIKMKNINVKELRLIFVNIYKLIYFIFSQNLILQMHFLSLENSQFQYFHIFLSN